VAGQEVWDLRLTRATSDLVSAPSKILKYSGPPVSKGRDSTDIYSLFSGDLSSDRIRPRDFQKMIPLAPLVLNSWLDSGIVTLRRSQRPFRSVVVTKKPRVCNK
jgi:hypothetical protein